jgi:hypothetical protein
MAGRARGGATLARRAPSTDTGSRSSGGADPETTDSGRDGERCKEKTGAGGHAFSARDAGLRGGGVAADPSRARGRGKRVRRRHGVR